MLCFEFVEPLPTQPFRDPPSGWDSPRISFSDGILSNAMDACHKKAEDHADCDSDSEFQFATAVGREPDMDERPADDLFSQGKLLPVHIVIQKRVPGNGSLVLPGGRRRSEEIPTIVDKNCVRRRNASIHPLHRISSLMSSEAEKKMFGAPAEKEVRMTCSVSLKHLLGGMMKSQRCGNGLRRHKPQGCENVREL